MLVFTVLLGLMQLPAPVPNGHDAPAITRPSSPVLVVEENPVGLTPQQKQALLRRFEQRFNKLVEAVEDFSIAYNQAKGQAWPADKAEALRKAILELQKVDPSFNPGKPDKASAEVPAQVQRAGR